jgi:hypothetical protein
MVTRICQSIGQSNNQGRLHVHVISHHGDCRNRGKALYNLSLAPYHTGLVKLVRQGSANDHYQCPSVPH